jgi:hypothetical protein
VLFVTMAFNLAKSNLLAPDLLIGDVRFEGEHEVGLEGRRGEAGALAERGLGEGE